MKDEQQSGLPNNPAPSPEASKGTGSRDGIGPTGDGPWEVFEGGNFVNVGVQGKYRTYVETEGYLGGQFQIADIHRGDLGNVNHALAVRRARLIAAAPELYEALELFEKHMQGAQFPTLETHTKMIAALAKARGEP